MRGKRVVLGALAAACASALLVVEPSARAHEPQGDAIIGNDAVQLGVHPFGHLNVPGGTPSSGTAETTVGLRFLPTNADVLSPACDCEGWGVADAETGRTAFANQNEIPNANNLVVQSFTSTATTATSVVADTPIEGNPFFRVTHAFAPAAETPNLYKVTVSIENLRGSAIADLRYRRVMDWDVEPTAFNEFVTIDGTAPPELLYSNNNGFATANPLGSRTAGLPATDLEVSLPEGQPLNDAGPRDHGALFDFGFGSLPAGETRTFTFYYGGAASETAALAAVDAVGADLYSLGQPNTDGGATGGTPNTFIFAYVSPGVSNVALEAVQSSVIAGAEQVLISDIPPSAVKGGQASRTSGTALDSIALDSIPLDSIALDSIALDSIPLDSIGLTAEILRNTLGGVHLSDIPLSSPAGGWSAVLANTGLAGVPLNTITLAQVYALPDPPTDGITLSEIDLSETPLDSIGLGAIALGPLALDSIPIEGGTTAAQNRQDWCDAMNAQGVSCPGPDSLQGKTLIELTLRGVALDSIPLDSIPLDSIPLDSIPLDSIPLDSIDVTGTALDSIPLDSIDVTGTALDSIALDSIDITGTALDSIALDSIALDSIDTLFDCSGNWCTGDKTLGDAVAENRIKDTATLGDLIAALLPNSGAQLGDLIDALPAGSGATLSDLLDSLPADTNARLSDLLESLPGGSGASLADLAKALPPGTTLGDLLAVLLGGADYDWESLPLDGSFPIQDFASVGGVITYRASYSVSGAGAPTPVTLEATLPAGVRYKAESTTLTRNGVVVDVGEPEQAAGSLKLTWQSEATRGADYVLEFQIRPGLALGVSSASVKLIVPGLAAKTAAAEDVQIEQTLEPLSQEPADSPELVEDALYFGHIPRGDRDYLRVPIPDAYGARTTIDLSHLPADYDLVVLGPETESLAPAALDSIPLGNPPLVDSEIPLAQHTQALPPETLQDVALDSIGPDSVVRASSDNRGQADEHLELISQGESGVYTILIDPFEDAGSDLPYMLRVNQSPPPVLPPCLARDFPTSEGTLGALPAIPPGVNTLFLLNKKRLGDTYGAAAANNVITKLGQLASRPDLGVTSAVVPVDGAAAVANAYAAWDANPCSPALANDVVTQITTLLDTLITPAMESQIKNVVLVGGDDIIPFGRIPDETEIANERTYANAVGATNNQFLGSFANGFLMTDDVYGDRSPSQWFGRKLYVPERSLGRLVEGPGQIMAQVDQFIARNARISPTTSLVTGYDFLIDGAEAVNAAFSGFGAGRQTLIDNGWSRADLINSLFPSAGTPPQINSINAHFDHRRALPADQDAADLQNDLFKTDHIPPGSMPGRLVFTMGCHAGVPAANAVFGPTALASDFAETVAIGGAVAYIGNTGFGLGDTVVPGYSERLHALFAQALGSGRTIGESLVLAKQQYIATGAVLTLYDEKVSVESTHYGLPMYRYGPDTAPAPQAEPLPTTTDSVTGLKVASFDEQPNLTLVSTVNGQYYRANGEPLGGIDITPRRPIEPLVAVDVTQPASVGLAHGAVIEHLVSPADQLGFDAAWSRVEFDSAQAGPELTGEGSSASKLQTITTFDVPGGGRQQQLLLLAGQFRSDGVPDSQGIGIQTTFTREQGKVYFSNSPDFVPPQFGSVEVLRIGTGSGATVGFSVDVTDKDQNANPGTVKRVFFLYRDCNGPWRKAELAKAPSPSNRWSGGGPISGDCGSVSYFGFAVDAAGNVGNTARKVLKASIVVDTEPGSITATLAGNQHSSGWYTGPVTVTLASSASGVQIKYSVDGGAFQTYGAPFQVTGAGVHTIDFEGSDGSDGTAIVPIDTAAPAIEITTPATGGAYVLGSTVLADYTCPDAGSGAKNCSGTVPSGQPINTSSVGSKSFTVTATDVVGHTSTVTRTYQVVYAFQGFFDPVKNPPGLNAQNAGSVIPMKFSLGGNQGLSIFAKDFPKSQQINCTTRALMGKPASTAAQPPGLKYTASSNTYEYLWKTDGRWMGTCRAFFLGLKDGSSPRADFRFN